MMKYMKKLVCVIAALALALTMPFQAVASGTSAAQGEKHSLVISSAGELLEFAEECRLDSYSSGLEVTLSADIELSGEFTPVPVFSGVFDGAGHTISGLKITADGSNTGLFRYIQRGALVKDLTVRGSVSPAGSGENVGGIAGCNSGNITGCSFEGVVTGSRNIGGIAGVNEKSGLISNSSASGAMSGSHCTGGITGTNSGTILNCTSRCSVNTTASETDLSIQDIDLDSIRSPQESASMTDAGGIAGYSDGIIQGCENFGTVGYQHIGYNVGGIVGRQCGFVNGCANHGEIFGRKDVGGIAGQMEPYQSIDFESDTVQKLLDEMDILGGLVDQLIDDAKGAGDAVNGKVQGLTWQMENLRRSADDIADRTTALYNGWTDGINEISARVDEALDGIAPALEGFRDGLDLLSRFSGSLEEVFDQLNASGDDMKKAIDEGEEGLDILNKAITEISAGLDDISAATGELAAGMGDTDRVEAAVKDIIKALGRINGEVKNISAALTEIGGACDKLEEWVTGKDFRKLADGLSALGESMQDITKALSKMSSALQKIVSAVDAEELQKALDEYTAASKELNEAAKHAAAALKEASSSVPDNDKIKDELSAAAENIEAAGEHVAKAAQHINNAIDSEQLSEGIKEMEAAAGELSKALDQAQDAIEDITDAFRNISSSDVPEDVYDEISKQLQNINAAVQNITLAADDINKALGEITDQIDSGRIKDGIQSVSDAAAKLSDAADTIASSSDSFNAAADDISAAIDKLQGAAESASDACVYLEKACDVFSDACGKLADTVKILGDKPKVEFPAADEGFTAAVDSFSNDFSGITGAISSISSTAQAQGDILLEDLRLISDEFGKITDILRELRDKTLSTDDDGFTTDVSEDGSGSRHGKVLSCTNSGGVQGDLNVGGITGSMAIDVDFDPEDDIASEGERSYSFSYKVRDMIDSCVNTGEITAKKNYCGGIVGKQDMGVVTSSLENGKVTSTSGSYAGGIAGYSASAVRSCIAKVTISACGYVGGIAGQGLILTDNAAILDVYDCTERSGSVAGFVDFSDGNAEVLRNSFVDRGTAGIDGISYSGKAAPVDFEKFRQLAGSAAVIDVSFVVDGETVSTVPVNYGGALSDSDFPVIPAKEGCFAEWSDFDSKCITFPVTVEAVYTPYVTLIESPECSEGGFGLVLADGEFGSSASVTVTTESSSVFPPDDHSELRIVTVDTAITGGSVTGLRFLAPEGRGELNVMQFVNGSWKDVAFTENGHYLIVDAPALENGTGTFCVQLRQFDLVPVLICGVCVLIALINVVLWTILLKHRKAVKNSHSSPEKSTQDVSEKSDTNSTNE